MSVFESVSSSNSSRAFFFDLLVVLETDDSPSPLIRRRGGTEGRGANWIVIGCTLIPRSRSLLHLSEATETAARFAMNDTMARSTIQTRQRDGRRLRQGSVVAGQTDQCGSGEGLAERREV